MYTIYNLHTRRSKNISPCEIRLYLNTLKAQKAFFQLDIDQTINYSFTPEYAEDTTIDFLIANGNKKTKDD